MKPELKVEKQYLKLVKIPLYFLPYKLFKIEKSLWDLTKQGQGQTKSKLVFNMKRRRNALRKILHYKITLWLNEVKETGGAVSKEIQKESDPNYSDILEIEKNLKYLEET